MPQCPMPSSDEHTSDPQSSSEKGSLPAAPDNDSTSGVTSRGSDGSISSEPDVSFLAQSEPAARETSTQSPGSQTGDPSSSEPCDSEGSPAISGSHDVDLSPSDRKCGSVSEDYGSVERSQDAASGSVAEGSPLHHSSPSSQGCPGRAASEEPADNSEGVSGDLPGPSTASQPLRSMADRLRQQCSGSDGGLSAREASQTDPETASALHEASCRAAPSRPSASMHSDDADKLCEESPISYPEQPHAALEGEGTNDRVADVAQDDQAEDENDADSSQHAASGSKRSRDTVDDAPAQREPKRCRSMFQRCSEALSGILSGLVMHMGLHDTPV